MERTKSMITLDIKHPVFQIVLDKNVNYLERVTLKFFKDGWYPVGGIGRKLNDWVQVMVRDEAEQEVEREGKVNKRRSEAMHFLNSQQLIATEDKEIRKEGQTNEG